MTDKLDMKLSPEEFYRHYWPREELSQFCLNHHIPPSVSRNKMMELIYNYLKEKK